MSAAPLVMRTASGFHNEKAFTGEADQLRQDAQWQYPAATGSPVTVNCTLPQKQLPSYVCMDVSERCGRRTRPGHCSARSRQPRFAERLELFRLLRQPGSRPLEVASPSTT